jgi:hypothetical protein
MTPREENRFESLVRDYVAGRVDWEAVHRQALEMEYHNETNFSPEIRRPLEELHMIFLADAQDDPQFHADRAVIEAALDELSRLRADVAKLGREAVAEREGSAEREKLSVIRSKFLTKRGARKDA